MDMKPFIPFAPLAIAAARHRALAVPVEPVPVSPLPGFDHISQEESAS